MNTGWIMYMREVQYLRDLMAIDAHDRTIAPRQEPTATEEPADHRRTIGKGLYLGNVPIYAIHHPAARRSPIPSLESLDGDDQEDRQLL